MEYSQAFPDLTSILLEDSWVLKVAPSERAVAFLLDAVLTPNHPMYHRPAAGEQHCYLTGWLTVRSSKPVEVSLSGAAPAVDASGDIDFGHIDTLALVNDETWELEGSWGSARAVAPEVLLRFD